MNATQEHEFLVSGCRYQWRHDHKHWECWDAFLAHHKAPAGLGIDEFYDWLEAQSASPTKAPG
jgi:hypothetical protein